MSEVNEELGSIEKSDDYFTATLIRFLDHSQQAVWTVLTEPGRFVDWLAPGEIELSKGGRARLNFVDSGIVIDSLVTECEVPALLEYSWSSGDEPLRPVRWQLQTDDGRTRLTLTLRVPQDEDVARSCAGWEAHLMMLLASMEGASIRFPFERFQSTRQAYNEMLAD